MQLICKEKAGEKKGKVLFHDDKGLIYLCDRIYSLKYLNGKGTTVNCPFLTKVTLISGSNWSKNSSDSLYGTILLMFAAHCIVEFKP